MRVQMNDSGLYHCESLSGNQTDKSHYINVTVQDDDTNTTDGHGVYKKDKAWIIYLAPHHFRAHCVSPAKCRLSPPASTWRVLS
ncbi:B- and T-lymphocyte attenuator isoform X2 [Sphaerodactylus townsendi]|uniref:B- and T-lymphocyte attenuator isoform X2 n=1 Tax=Sphaerodactylus townsendi TaxID=933632 RepID=UPI0020269FBE|nr:B- and T-lymphocyte attenuator isoform X2 [Sphaerodactylus townsendi]